MARYNQYITRTLKTASISFLVSQIYLKDEQLFVIIKKVFNLVKCHVIPYIIKDDFNEIDFSEASIFSEKMPVNKEMTCALLAFIVSDYCCTSPGAAKNPNPSDNNEELPPNSTKASNLQGVVLSKLLASANKHR